MQENAETSVLLQGDNQIITRKYKVNAADEKGILRELDNIKANNERMLDKVRVGSGKLGLTLNQDEVMTSCEFINYGKLLKFRDKTIPLEIKRLSRVMSVTNGQLPSFSANLSSTSTAALTICQYSDSPVYSMLEYSFFGALTFMLSMIHSVVLGESYINTKTNFKNPSLYKFVIGYLYKDPSLGGVSGMNCFMLRGFPDPVTESLSWWKMIYDNGNSLLKELAMEAGNPLLGPVDQRSFYPLLGKPESLNIPGAISYKTTLKEEVRKGLRDHLPRIHNTFLKEAINYNFDNTHDTVNYIMQIKPLFPIFNSEFYQSTFLKLADSVIGLFDNSNTIQRIFSEDFSVDIWEVIRRSERDSLKQLIDPRIGNFEYFDFTDLNLQHAQRIQSGHRRL